MRGREGRSEIQKKVKVREWEFLEKKGGGRERVMDT